MLTLPIGEFEEGDVDGTFCFARSVTQALREIAARRPICTAGDKGAINAWIENGAYTANFQQWMLTKAVCRTKSKAELRRFLKQWWPVMTGDAP